ncbi:MAG: beta-3-deoxy-D-manno-oct-2-ulosonic acid transferase [Rhodobacterales bacterium]|nr:MAG: beta-3-deoxy-D-manno-oct-2-ulosonic acid transferase [Rhodobacterales bacterium]
MDDPENSTAAGPPPRRLFVFNGGFLNARIRRILALAGWQVALGKPGAGDTIGIWGHAGTAHRGEAVADKTGADILRIEDAFLRSVATGREGEPPMGLLLDRRGVHYDSAQVTDLEELLATHPLDDTALLTRARHAIDLQKTLGVSKYNRHDPTLPLPDAPYILILDQTAGDASIAHAGATEHSFREMLVTAQIDHPGARIVIKTHPETQAGTRAGHFSREDENDRVTLLDAPVCPWALMEGASHVFTVSSGMGFEAILAGHKPRVFGQPFYAGWGLTEDENPVWRRQRKLTRAQIYAAAMLLYPHYYDPFHDCTTGAEQVITTLAARARAAREDGTQPVLAGMRLWKRGPLSRFFTAPRFLPPAKAVARARATDAPLFVWAGRAAELGDTEGLRLYRVEDGFLRSRGLGAELTAPMSLVTDDLGIYYDPTRESRLERHIAAATRLPAGLRARAERLIAGIRAAGLSKYNLERAAPDLPEGRRILVPGQVEDDASIRLGTTHTCTNLALLQAARAANPEAVIIYKPHPDVEAGLRAGRIAPEEAARLADVIAEEADPLALIEAVDEVWTMTSLLGFEALLRDTPVTCVGAPFYAGWGLTTDLGDVPARRRARPDLIALAHAVLIDYPRYHDPVTNSACPPEVVVDRLAAGHQAPTGPAIRLLAKLQGVFASYAWLWR